MKPTAYPLQWPAGWPRTQYRSGTRFRGTLPKALAELESELRLMGGKNLVLSSNCSLGQSNAADPGVVAYFEWNGQHLAIPCDRWRTVTENVQAIVKTIEAMRGIERWGAKHMIQAMFSGFKALPEAPGKRKWYAVFDCGPNDPTDEVLRRYRALAIEKHPDRGGTHEAMTELNVALAEFKRERGIQ